MQSATDVKKQGFSGLCSLYKLYKVSETIMKLLLLYILLLCSIINPFAQELTSERFFLGESDSNQIRIFNNGEKNEFIELSVDGKKLFSSTEDIVDFISKMKDEVDGEDLVRKSWRFTRDFRYHNVPISGHCWYSSNPTVMLNSVGFGWCGNVSAWNYVIWNKMGFQTRYWELNGIHVVSEVFNKGRWEMYDSDNEVYYLNYENNVASVEDLMSDATLITNPIQMLELDTLNTLGLNSLIANYASKYAYSEGKWLGF